MKKLLSLLLTLATVLTMGFAAVPAFADETQAATTHSITINQPENSKDTATHTYSAHQVFAGDYSTDDATGDTLSNITWGDGVDTTKITGTVATAIKTALGKSDDADFYVTDAAKVAEALNSTNAKAFAQAIKDALNVEHQIIIIGDALVTSDCFLKK